MSQSQTCTRIAEIVDSLAQRAIKDAAESRPNLTPTQVEFEAGYHMGYMHALRQIIVTSES